MHWLAPLLHLTLLWANCFGYCGNKTISHSYTEANIVYRIDKISKHCQTICLSHPSSGNNLSDVEESIWTVKRLYVTWDSDSSSDLNLLHQNCTRYQCGWGFVYLRIYKYGWTLIFQQFNFTWSNISFTTKS